MFKSFHAVTLALGCLSMLGGCAANVPRAQYTVKPQAAHLLKPDDAPKILVSSASRDIPLLDVDRARIGEKIGRLFQTPIEGADVQPPYRVQVTITRYDKGNAFARAMLAGLGQIHIDAEIKVLAAPDDALVNQFSISKTFAWGGVYGASTTIVDVEDPFAQAIAYGLQGKSSDAPAPSTQQASSASTAPGGRVNRLQAGALREQAMSGQRSVD